MKLFIATDFRTVHHDNRLYLASQYYFIVQRYNEEFGSVVLCSRVVDDNNIDGLYDVTEMLSGFVGSKNLYDPLKKSFQDKMFTEIRECDLVVCRYHAITASVAANLAKKANKPLYAEIMGDAWDSYWNHSIKGKIIAPFMFFNTKKCVRNADYALYVTQQFLQSRYPTNGKQIGVSDVKIFDMNELVLTNKLDYFEKKDYSSLNLMTTAAVDVIFKGQQYVIEAIPRINKSGIHVHYSLVGGGSSDYLTSIAKKLGVLDQIEFKGKMPLDRVFNNLDKTDIYIQPSLQEGLPRSVVEAMSRACPCIGARTGGIPELLQEDQIFDRKSPEAIAEKIIAFANAEDMKRMSKSCFLKASEFLDSTLSEKRNDFYNFVKADLS